MSSSADADGVVTVSDSGVSVTKQFAPDEFPVPAIRFEIESSRDEPVSVRIGEEIPESFPMDAVGFHPDFHSDQWVAYQNHRVEFTGVVDPDSSLITVYGIRVDEDFEPSAFLTDPSIVAVEPADESSDETPEADPTAVEEVIPDDRNEVVKTMLAGDSEAIPGLEDDDTDSEIELDIDAAAERVAAREPASTDTDSSDAESVTDEFPSEGTDSKSSSVADEADVGAQSSESSADDLSSSPDDSGRSVEELDPASVAHLFAVSLREESLSSDDRETIRSAISPDADAVSTAKIDHLQRRVEEVSAYSNALEEFLESEGTGAQLVEELRTELDSVHAEFDTIRSSVDGVESTIHTLEPTVTDLETNVASVETTAESALDELATVEESVDSITARIDTLESSQQSIESSIERVEDDSESLRADLSSLDESMESSIESVESRVDSVESSLDTVDENVDSVESTVSSISGNVSDLEGTIDDVESDLDSVAEDVDDIEETVSDVEADVESVRADVTDILDWRDQLGSMFSDD